MAFLAQVSFGGSVLSASVAPFGEGYLSPSCFCIYRYLAIIGQLLRFRAFDITLLPHCEIICLDGLYHNATSAPHSKGGQVWRHTSRLSLSLADDGGYDGHENIY